jgi:hypothetical protein
MLIHVQRNSAAILVAAPAHGSSPSYAETCSVRLNYKVGFIGASAAPVLCSAQYPYGVSAGTIEWRGGVGWHRINLRTARTSRSLFGASAGPVAGGGKPQRSKT